MGDAKWKIALVWLSLETWQEVALETPGPAQVGLALATWGQTHYLAYARYSGFLEKVLAKTGTDLSTLVWFSPGRPV